jgi:hypothetical protein
MIDPAEQEARNDAAQYETERYRALRALVTSYEAKQWAGEPITDQEAAAYHQALSDLAETGPDYEPEPFDPPESHTERAARRRKYGRPWF